MSVLVRRAIAAAGLENVLVQRRAGDVRSVDVGRLLAADLLVLGALADRVRAEEVGCEVRILTFARFADGGVLALPPMGRDMTGLEFLRAVAVARLTGPRASTVRIDFALSGLEIAQVALGFGANELMGPIVSRSGAAFAEGALVGVGKKSRRELASVVRRREIEGFVRLAGRDPVFVDAEGPRPAGAERMAEDGGS
jgi:hypothetical protein